VLAVAVIVGCIPLGQRRAARVLPLVHTGQLALTHYVSHVLFLIGPLMVLCAPEKLGLVRPPALPASGPVLLLAIAGWTCVSVWASHAWRKRWRRGPLEQLMRTLTTPRLGPSTSSAP
jgi:uncharacterized membrane protein YeiB